MLRLGQIAYLNVWPIFQTLKKSFPPGKELAYLNGHPSELNRALLAGEIDVAPASSFNYLKYADQFAILPGACITAADGPIKSVLLLSPVSIEELPEYLDKVSEAGNIKPTVEVSTASASSTALLKILWQFFWKLPAVDWIPRKPGQRLNENSPFMEIGDIALSLYLNPLPGLHIIDLGEAWKKFTDLPFVFALWIVRENLNRSQCSMLKKITAGLHNIIDSIEDILPALSTLPSLPKFCSADNFLDYFKRISYRFGAKEAASLILFAELCRQMGFIEAVPAINFFQCHE